MALSTICAWCRHDWAEHQPDNEDVEDTACQHNKNQPGKWVPAWDEKTKTYSTHKLRWDGQRYTEGPCHCPRFYFEAEGK